MKYLISTIFLLCSVFSFAQIEKDIPRPQNPPKLVNDFTGTTLTPLQIKALEEKLVAFDDSSSSQIAVVIVPDLKGYPITEFSFTIGRDWGIGGKEFNNGILVLVAIKEKKVRIEVGYGLEGSVPDITARHIIDEVMTPAFKEGNYYRGLDLGTDDLIKATRGKYIAPEGYRKKKKGVGGPWGMLGLIAVLVILGAIGGGGRSSGGSLSGAGWILGSLLGGSGGGRSSGGGWSGGGGGGGGFGGFGGGSFGGGGASGSW
jgi:uncharacterized protein